MIVAELTGHAHNNVLAKAGGQLHVEQNIKLCPPSPIPLRYMQAYIRLTAVNGIVVDT
jgi:hypothetical protein